MTQLPVQGHAHTKKRQKRSHESVLVPANGSDDEIEALLEQTGRRLPNQGESARTQPCSVMKPQS